MIKNLTVANAALLFTNILSFISLQLLSGFHFTDFTVYKLSSSVTNKDLTLETSGLPFALFYHLAQINQVSFSSYSLSALLVKESLLSQSLIAMKYYSNLSRLCTYTSNSVKPSLPWEINLSPEDKSTVLLKQVVDVFI